MCIYLPKSMYRLENIMDENRPTLFISKYKCRHTLLKYHMCHHLFDFIFICTEREGIKGFVTFVRLIKEFEIQHVQDCRLCINTLHIKRDTITQKILFRSFIVSTRVCAHILWQRTIVNTPAPTFSLFSKSSNEGMKQWLSQYNV